MLGSPLFSTLALLSFSIFLPLFPLHSIISGQSLPLPITPLSPTPLLLPSYYTAPPCLSTLLFIGNISLRLLFPSTI
jgi:hypothetical protein